MNIAETLYKSMLVENWGSGARRIMEACQEQGVKEPTWRQEGGFVYVTFKRPQNGIIETHSRSTPQVPLKYPSSTP